MSDERAFESICGDCQGIEIMDITEDDIRAQAQTFNDQGEFCDENQIEAAIRHLEWLKSQQ